ncbi:4Fe-4S dicluster domain-containing protein [Candidatus Zixiibacteriota bacterium]
MKKPKLRELKEAVTALIKGPYTDKFPKAPATVMETYRGKPEYHEDDCVVCGACGEVCPVSAIDMVDERREDGTAVRRMVLHYDICIMCGQCQRACITKKGIILSNEFDLALFDHNQALETVEDELLTCEVCGEFITTRKHSLWIADKLGPIGYSNPNLILVSHQDKGLVDETGQRPERPLKRNDNMRLLCPGCRRSLIQTDEWG